MARYKRQAILREKKIEIMFQTQIGKVGPQHLKHVETCLIQTLL